MLAFARFGEAGTLRLVRAIGSDLIRCSGEAFDQCAPMGIDLGFLPERLLVLEG